MYNKKSNTGGTPTILDCDEEVVVLNSNGRIFTHPLVDLDTTKQHLNGRMQFVLYSRTGRYLHIFRL